MSVRKRKTTNSAKTELRGIRLAPYSAADDLAALRALADPAGLPERYAICCDGACMEPEIPDGSVVVCDRKAKIEVGDFVVVFYKPEFVKPGAFAAVVKRLVTRVPSEFKLPYEPHPEDELEPMIGLEMLNPRKRWMTSLKSLLGLHKCLGCMPKDAIFDPKRRTWRLLSPQRRGDVVNSCVGLMHKCPIDL